MLPYLIAGAIGFVVAKIFEDDEAPKYADGGSVLLAQNGKPSNLTPEQYKLVRTPEFKAWFGDWENDLANASKVVDENGEPLVVYHYSNKDFNVFKSNGFIETLSGKVKNYGTYFTNNDESREFYLQKKGNLEYECFIKLLNPYYCFDYSWSMIINDERLSFLAKNKFDGVITKDITINEFITLESNQIKLADGTNTTFDGNNPDIRFKGGGSVLLAPNGKPSNLTPLQYKLVRTPAFKAWFGDWENDPTNASKVVDENGEPLVVWHGSRGVDEKTKFNSFNLGNGAYGEGIYFTADKKEASGWALGNYIYEVFLDVKNPFRETYYRKWNQNVTESKNYSGIIVMDFQDVSTIIVFEPEQIKLADGTNKTFDGSNSDIRFKRGGQATNYTEFYNNLQIEDGTQYVGQKFSDVFPFLYRRKTPHYFRLRVKQYYGIVNRLAEDNYSTKAMKQMDVNKLKKLEINFDKTEYLASFYLDSNGIINKFNGKRFKK